MKANAPTPSAVTTDGLPPASRNRHGRRRRVTTSAAVTSAPITIRPYEAPNVARLAASRAVNDSAPAWLKPVDCSTPDARARPLTLSDHHSGSMPSAAIEATYAP